MKSRRKSLRSNLTPAEAFLWNHLKNSKLEGRKFRRQHSFGSYILDFYCSSEKLGIELDGMPHFIVDNIEYYERRTKFLNSMGIKVLNFENAEIFERTTEVLQEIKRFFKSNHPVTS